MHTAQVIQQYCVVSAYISPLHVDVVYEWENPEYKVVEDSESLEVQLCLATESGTLTFPVQIYISTTAISATGK